MAISVTRTQPNRTLMGDSGGKVLSGIPTLNPNLKPNPYPNPYIKLFTFQLQWGRDPE